MTVRVLICLKPVRDKGWPMRFMPEKKEKRRKLFLCKYSHRGSNPGPRLYQSRALPTELWELDDEVYFHCHDLDYHRSEKIARGASSQIYSLHDSFLVNYFYSPAQPVRVFTLSDLLDEPWSRVSSLPPPVPARHMPPSSSRICRVQRSRVPAFLVFARRFSSLFGNSSCSRALRSYFFFFFHTHLLSSLWASRGHRCRPCSPPVLAFIYLSCIGFSNPTTRRFFIECC